MHRLATINDLFTIQEIESTVQIQPVGADDRLSDWRNPSQSGHAMVKSIRGTLGPVLIGAGILSFVSPVVLYWFIHGDPERYLWIISGPAPFSSFGGGPFQLYLYAGLVIAGILAIASGFVAQRRGRVPRTSPH